MKVNLKDIKLSKEDVMNLDMTPGDYACLKVADTGVGINNDLIINIFDPFFTTLKE